MRTSLLMLCSLVLVFGSQAQDYELKSTPEVYGDLQKLHRGMRVLYLAAHPDDENTRLISWLENAEHIETAYLSLTRGQGGQNLIGDEKGDGLGVIRSYELMEARKTDGGAQYFTRAVDFGYSKSATESFEKWGKEEVLADVVYVIRKFRPHLIVTRFPPNRNAGHGHHEASAILAEEAFDLAADATKFPEQLDRVQPWQPVALYHNTSTWWDKSMGDLTPEQLAEKKMHKVNIGVFSELRGQGINEIASLARSKHRCQAFGTSRDRGERMEYLKLVKGTWQDDFPSGYAGLWARSPAHQEAIAKAIEGFDFTNRANNIELLKTNVAPKLAQRSAWAEGPDVKAVNDAYNSIMLDLIGLRVEAYAGQDAVVTGEEFTVNLEAFNSGSKEVNVRFSHPSIDTSFSLPPGIRVNWKTTFTAPNSVSNPFWLERAHGDLYELTDSKNLGLPELPAEAIGYSVKTDGFVLRATTGLHRRWTDRSYGEFTQPMAYVPFAHVSPITPSLVVPIGREMNVRMTVKAFNDLQDYTLTPAPIKGWNISPASASVSLAKGQETVVEFTATPTKEAKADKLNFSLSGALGTVSQAAYWIDYDHIPQRVVHTPSAVNLLPVDLAPGKGRILYVDGSGDEVDEALELMGYTVEKKPLADLSADELKNYKAVVLGIRAINRNKELPSYYSMLLDYAKAGGNLIVQYNTTYDLKIKDFGPYPIELSRNRVTEEGAEAKLLKPNHPVFSTPNKIGDADFDGWVQERGLYFAGSWDEKNYTPLIAWHDKGEDDVEGGLLVAHTGSGSFFYTGISFFRELPKGVPGAYRLLMNMIEYTP